MCFIGLSTKQIEMPYIETETLYLELHAGEIFLGKNLVECIVSY